MTKQFDIFVSYKSEDGNDAERLVAALQRRGIQVWLDKDSIRPGDWFAEALENGLASSKAVGMVITPQSLKSNWVKDEYYRALSIANDGELQLIPLLFRSAKLPGFLRTRHFVDFRNEADFERSVDRLIWPGITGKSVVFVAVYPGLEDFFDPSPRDHLKDLAPWYRLYMQLKREGLRMVGGEDIDRAEYRIRKLQTGSPTRIVAVVDPFEGWPATANRRLRNAPRDYVDFIFNLRDRTRGTSNEIVFLLFYHSEAWEKVRHELDEPSAKRLRHFFVMHTNAVADNMEEPLVRMWWRIQQELLQVENLVHKSAQS